ncbi:MAG: flagellar hook-basal body protein [Chloroflexi bacterium]|nr:flagellar hook-basal body protein [Chloroflexota bacterium]
MIRGVYVAAAGMVASMTRLNRLANNIANVATPGYKQDVASPEVFEGMMLARVGQAGGPQQIGPLTTVVVAERPRVDLTQGALQATGGELDFSLSGPGFFAVEKEGARYFTRNGAWMLDPNRALRTLDGGLVLGAGGPITIPPGTLTVETNGQLAVDGRVVDTLSVVDFPEGTAFQKIGHSYLQAVGAEAVPARAFEVHQGFLEASNVNAMDSMVELLTSHKNYGASQRFLQLADQALAKAVNELGRV